MGKVIGNGSYGTVYEAYYTKQKVMLAVKIISKKASEDYLNKFLSSEIQVGKGAGRGNGTKLLKAPQRVMVRRGWGQKPTNQNYMFH